MKTILPSEVVSPSEARLRADLAGDAFVAGMRDGKWRSPDLDWPRLLVDVAVGDSGYTRLCIQLDEYPVRAPHGQLWNPELGAPLAATLWPRGGSAERVFRVDWSLSNQNSPYLPCDRVALSTHPNWATEYPARAWNASRSIDFYLEEIAGELADACLPQLGATA